MLQPVYQFYFYFIGRVSYSVFTFWTPKSRKFTFTKLDRPLFLASSRKIYILALQNFIHFWNFAIIYVKISPTDLLQEYKLNYHWLCLLLVYLASFLNASMHLNIFKGSGLHGRTLFTCCIPSSVNGLGCRRPERPVKEHDLLWSTHR